MCRVQSAQSSTQYLSFQPHRIIYSEASLYRCALGYFLVCFQSPYCAVRSHNPQVPVTNGFWSGWPVGSTVEMPGYVCLCGLLQRPHPPKSYLLPGDTVSRCSLYLSSLGVAVSSLCRSSEFPTVFSFVSQLCKNHPYIDSLRLKYLERLLFS